MAFTTIKPGADKKKFKTPPFISINNTYGYIGQQLYDLLGAPSFIDLEYDPETKVLRLRPTEDPKRIAVTRGHFFQISKLVCQNLKRIRDPQSRRGDYYRSTQKWSVVRHKNGWWYTVEKL